MIIGLGSDICNIRRVEKAYERFGGRFLARCFGAEERRELDAIGGDKARFTASLAKRFAAKEAFVKALGTGFAHGIAWAEIEVVHPILSNVVFPLPLNPTIAVVFPLGISNVISSSV